MGVRGEGEGTGGGGAVWGVEGGGVGWTKEGKRAQYFSGFRKKLGLCKRN